MVQHRASSLNLSPWKPMMVKTVSVVVPVMAARWNAPLSLFYYTNPLKLILHYTTVTATNHRRCFTNKFRFDFWVKNWQIDSYTLVYRQNTFIEWIALITIIMMQSVQNFSHDRGFCDLTGWIESNSRKTVLRRSLWNGPLWPPYLRGRGLEKKRTSVVTEAEVEGRR